MHSKLQLKILSKGMYQKDVAAACGFPPPRLSDYIHGTRPLPPRHIILLCKVLECSPEEIMGEEYVDLENAR